MKTPSLFSTMTVLGLGFAGWLLGMPVSTLAAGENGSTPRKSSAGLRMLEELQTVITDLAEEAKPSVVSIFPSRPQGDCGMPESARPTPPVPGSGVIVDANGHIITNNHVVGDAAEVEVRLSDKTKLFAR